MRISIWACYSDNVRVWSKPNTVVHTVLVQGLMAAHHNVTVPELDEIEQQQTVKACTLALVSS